MVLRTTSINTINRTNINIFFIINFNSIIINWIINRINIKIINSGGARVNPDGRAAFPDRGARAKIA